MIDEKRYNAWFRKEGLLSSDEMVSALDEKFACARCGRADLPLAMMPHHDKSCRFECGHLINGPAIQAVEEMQQKLDDSNERIRVLEMSCRDGLRTIQWLEGWLNDRSEPVMYDRTGFSVSYIAREVAIMKNSMAKTIGDSHLVHVPAVAKDICKWCNPILAE